MTMGEAVGDVSKVRGGVHKKGQHQQRGQEVGRRVAMPIEARARSGETMRAEEPGNVGINKNMDRTWDQVIDLG